MANWLNIVPNEITSAVRGVAVIISDKLKYKTPYTAIDFEDDELITKRGALGLIAGAAEEPLIIPIPTNSEGFYAYAYDQSMGEHPLFYVQQIVGSDIVNRFDITVKINGAGDTITAGSDFSMDSYQLVIRK